jgi:hypothetical protein
VFQWGSSGSCMLAGCTNALACTQQQHTLSAAARISS